MSERGRTIREAADAGDSYQLESADRRSLWMPGCVGLEATLEAARGSMAWRHRIGETVKVYRVLPGSGVGCMYLEPAGEAVL